MREPSGQRSLTRTGGDLTVRNDHDCQHRGGAGARADGMTNIREPLLNAVTDDKPKVLLGLNQKGTWQVQGFPTLLPQTQEPPADQRGLTHRGTHAERGKPVATPSGKANREASRRGCG